MPYDIEAIRAEIRKKMSEPSTEPLAPWVPVQRYGSCGFISPICSGKHGGCVDLDGGWCCHNTTHPEYVNGHGYFTRCNCKEHKGLDILPSPISEI
jgi:hypothetical protein